MSALCLKEEVVLTIKDIDGKPAEVQKIVNPELLPLGLKEVCTTETFFNWLNERKMPEKREGLQDVINQFGDSWLNENINFLSLNDHYWLRKRDEKYKKINFFQQAYNPDMGNMFFAPWKVNNTKIRISPDLTTGGVLKKRWKQNNDRTSYLVKAGSVAAKQEPLSEVLVSILCERLNVIETVKYDLCVEGITMCSKCDNFIDINTDFVPATYVYFNEPRPKDESVRDHLVRMCNKFDIPNAEEYINWLIFIDTITGNEDRNLNNIGFIRNINTLKIIKPAPMFDCGNAYWNTKKVNDDVKSKLFGDVEKQIYNKLKSKCNLDVLDNKDYEDVIQSYPEISDVKKENLIGAIRERNKKIMYEVNDLSK